jgi:hypothetical protein
MSLNIIIRGPKKSMSDGELNDYLAKENNKTAYYEKQNYMNRQRKVAKDNEHLKGTSLKNMKPTGAIDLTTFVRMEQNDPGFWDDKGSRDSFMRDNPECRIQPD